MKKIILIGIAYSLALSSSLAQQRPVQSLYMFDPLLINPAYAGSQVQLSATSIYRNQWVNFPGAPKTLTASVHSGFFKARVGVGLIVGRDEIGVHSETSLYGVYAYKIPVTRYSTSTISFGIQGGFNNLESDYGILNPKDPDVYGTLTKFNPNFGAGIYFRSKKGYAGFSVPYIINNRVIASEMLGSVAQQFRYYYLMGGFTRQIAPNLKMVPSTLVRFQERAPISFDLNLVSVLYDVVGLGVSYRYDDSVIGMFELQLNDNFHVGYGYDFTTSDIRTYSNGTHEIMINYRVKFSRIHTGLECPSYW